MTTTPEKEDSSLESQFLSQRHGKYEVLCSRPYGDSWVCENVRLNFCGGLQCSSNTMIRNKLFGLEVIEITLPIRRRQRSWLLFWLKLIAGNQVLNTKRASKNWQIEGGVASKVLKRVTYSEYSGDLAWRLVVSQERRTPTEASLFINSATDPTTCRFPNQIRCHKEDVDAQGMSSGHCPQY